MITPMTRYTFLMLGGEQDALLDRLQELGLMDITRSVKPVDNVSSRMLSEAELIQGLVKGIEHIKIPEGTEALPVEGDLIETAGEVIMQYTAHRDNLKKAEKALQERQVWGRYDPEAIRTLKEAGVPLHFHITSRKAFQSEWETQCALCTVANENNKVYYVVAGEDPLPDEVPAPGGDVDSTTREVESIRQAITEDMGRALTIRKRIDELERTRRDTLIRLDRYLAGAAAESAVEDHIVTLTGFAPSERDEEVASLLDQTGVFYLKEAATADDNPPIKLKNNRFVRMFEVLTDMYGRPSYNEFDPTPFLSVFFLLFFAMCMGDAGYGLVLFIGGLILRKVKGFEDLAPLVATLGVGTFVVGIVMHTFFGVDIAALPWIPSWLKSVMVTGTIAGFEAQMVLALLIGILHLCLAMVVKTVYATRNRGFLGSLSVWGWTLLIVGGVIVAALAMFSLLPPAITRWIVIGLGILSALGIFIFNDIHRNPLKNIGSGLWETYNTATGLLGDVLSYLRLYALGLAGGMLGKAFNDIATMTLGDGGFGWIPFVVILLIGHTLNLAMCCLGAFVHPLRLNFLEFFKNSGYQGTGRNYNPMVNK